MSADLLAEFGSASASKPSQNTSSQSQHQFQTSSLIPDLDFFGDSTTHHVSSGPKPANHGSVGGPGHQTVQPHISSPPLNENIWRHDSSGADVLFDATTETAPAAADDDDDWGEFETPEAAPGEEEDIFASKVDFTPKVTSTPKVSAAPEVSSTAKVFSPKVASTAKVFSTPKVASTAKTFSTPKVASTAKTFSTAKVASTAKTFSTPKVTSAPKVASTPKVSVTPKAAVQSVSVGSNSTTKGVSAASSGVDNLMDLLSIEDKCPSIETRQPSASIKSEIPASINHQSPQRKDPNTLQTPIAEDKQDSFDEWGDFVDADDGKPSNEKPSNVKPSNVKPSIQEQKSNMQVKNQNTNKQGSKNKPKPSLPTATSFNSTSTPQTSEASESQVRPTNVPPPSVLLQLFPPLFERLQEDAAAAKKDDSQTAFSLYLVLNLACTLKVASRIIVGRTLRWKRDFILSQSTKIGPARSGKQGGMKLSTVSKSENVKEEQEAVEVLDAWRRRAALFNSLLMSSGERVIPVVAVHAPVQTVKGALKAPHACFLCGLKRDERLPKIDDNAQDSFGEWWVEYWGHTDCKQFWEEHSKSLHQR